MLCRKKNLIVFEYKRKIGDHMSEKEMMQRNVEEFARLQDYMIDTDKE